MYIPQNCLIPNDKLTCYLLVFKVRNDKSQFLAQAGFTQANPEQLKEALLNLIQSYSVAFDRSDQYGDFYQVIGTLRGINTINLEVVTIWIQRKVDAQFQFVTLMPQRRNSMELELYKEVVVIKDLPEYDLRSGDVATLIDYIPHPEQGEEGAILEVFNDLNESIKVLTVPKSSIRVWQPLNNSQVIQEALSILIKHMEPQKFAQFVVACRLDKGITFKE